MVTRPDRRALWVVGEPGAGKTSLVRGLLGPRAGWSHLVDGRVKWTLSRHPALGELAAAGIYRGDAFDGADKVPYDGAAACLAFLRDALGHVPLVIFDGDRFSSAASVDFVRGLGRSLECAYVRVPAMTAEGRRVARAAGGRLPNAAWVRGRATKASRFAAGPGWHRTTEVDGTKPPAEAQADLAMWLMGGGAGG